MPLLYKQFSTIRSRYALRAYTCMSTFITPKPLVLGIETSCDDTGCAIIDSSGNILGESLNSQNIIHTRYGGVNPIVAYNLHRDNIEMVVAEALDRANKTFKDIDAISVTTKPGLLVSLQVGVKYANYLSRIHNKPLIPVHHMEAHSLVARMYHNIAFPFLVLLISGGHCLLTLVNDVEEFILLGKGLDNAPGEVLDKVARRMKLKNIPEYSKICGGRAVELAALKATNPGLFEFPLPLLRYRDCNFSFSGLKDSLVRKLIKKETEHQVMGCELIPEVNDLCAAFQIAVAEHLVQRTHRAVMYCEKYKLIPPENRNIVVSGGVACNDFIFKAIELIANSTGYKALRPPPKVCTDNGIMIAWNGLERIRKKCDMKNTISLQDIDPTAPLGVNMINKVKDANIQTKPTRLKNTFDIYDFVYFNSLYPFYYTYYSAHHKFAFMLLHNWNLGVGADEGDRWSMTTAALKQTSHMHTFVVRTVTYVIALTKINYF